MPAPTRLPLWLAFAALPALPPSAGAQTLIQVPDNQPAVGTCNIFPLGSATFTYAARVPASYLTGSALRLLDVAFAPCASGTWACPTVQMGIGHVPNPLPVPFNFPTFDAAGVPTNLGNFLDYTPLWNSVTQGPLSWAYTANAWSPFGFQTGGGTSFVWNGVDDIGWFITLQNATGTTSCHRTNTEPFRVYASGAYQAATSNGSGASGLKMELTMGSFSPNPATVTAVGTGCGGPAAPAPALSSNFLPSLGNPAFAVDVSQALPNSAAFLFASVGLAPAPIPIGGGCFLHLEPLTAQFLISAGLFPLGPVATDLLGIATFPLPVPGIPSWAGIHIGVQAAILDGAAPLGFGVTNALDLLLN